MADFDFDIKMPEGYKKALLNLVDEAIKKSTLTFRAFGDEDRHFVASGEKSWDVELPGNPFYSFDALGLIKIFRERDKEGNKTPIIDFVITTNGFKWADYQKKSKLQRLFIRHPHLERNIAIGFAFIASLILTILQAAQIINPKFMDSLRQFLGVNVH